LGLQDVEQSGQDRIVQIAAGDASGGELTQGRSEVWQQRRVRGARGQVQREVQLSLESPAVSARSRVLQAGDGGATSTVGANRSGAGKQCPASTHRRGGQTKPGGHGPDRWKLCAGLKGAITNGAAHGLGEAPRALQLEPFLNG
jgi:hypothetical protein